MKKARLAFITFFFGIGVIPLAIVSARREPATIIPLPTATAPIPNQSPQTLQCSAKNAGNEKPTYLVGAANLSASEKKRIKNEYGTLAIPKGETKRAEKIRAAALARQNNKIKKATDSFEQWRKAQPNAPAEILERNHRILQNYIDSFSDNSPLNKRKIAERKFDYMNIAGAVLNQGRGCNTCWAFASIDSARASIKRNPFVGYNEGSLEFNLEGNARGKGSGVMAFPGNPSPFVQDLLNCMPIPEKEICHSGWHGLAFEFMISGKGVPMSREADFSGAQVKNGVEYQVFLPKAKHEYTPGQKFSCAPDNGFVKALSWDYVNSPPDKMPSVEQLKTALVKHGPLAAPIRYDECLGNYRGGVFNEKNLGTVNHVVLLVGWDDAKEAWLIKNSWGEDWGEKGFGWIKYGSNNIGVFAAWIDARNY
jgi:hypothetical protein